jgi:hypothetical protein
VTEPELTTADRSQKLPSFLHSQLLTEEGEVSTV